MIKTKNNKKIATTICSMLAIILCFGVVSLTNSNIITSKANTNNTNNDLAVEYHLENNETNINTYSNQVLTAERNFSAGQNVHFGNLLNELNLKSVQSFDIIVDLTPANNTSRDVRLNNFRGNNYTARLQMYTGNSSQVSFDGHGFVLNPYSIPNDGENGWTVYNSISDFKMLVRFNNSRLDFSVGTLNTNSSLGIIDNYELFNFGRLINFSSSFSTVNIDELKTASFVFPQTASIIINYTQTDLLHQPVQLPPDPVKEGHRFAGWYFDQGFTMPYDGSQLFENTVLYAKFVAQNQTVSFDTGTSEIINSITVAFGTSATNLPTVTREGHTFKGWLINGMPYINQIITADTILTANWERNTITVTFIVDGEEYKTIDVLWGATLEEVQAEVGMNFFNLQGILLASGASLNGVLDSVILTENAEIFAVAQDTPQKIGTFARMYGMQVVATIVALFAFLGALDLLTKNKKAKIK